MACPPSRLSCFLPCPKHPVYMAFNILPSLFTLAPELVNMPGDRKVVNEVYGGTRMVEGNNLHPVGVAYLHKLCVLCSPSVTKEPVDLGGDNDFYLPIGNFS